MVRGKEQLKGSPELRDRMPRGSIAALAAKYNKSWTWIFKVVSGKFDNSPEIVSDAAALAKVEDIRKVEMDKIIHGNRKEMEAL